MRDSIGATYIFSLSITFTLLLTGFIAISINYARAFQINNNLISKIEEHEGYDQDLDSSMSSYLVSVGNNAYGNCESDIVISNITWTLQKCLNDNVPAGTTYCNACIYRGPKSVPKIGQSRYQYRVVTFFRFDLPIIKYYANFKVSGESRYVYDYANP